MATSPKQSELLQLQQEITREISGDAPAIAAGVFGDNKNHPDIAQVPNTQLDDLYRQKFQSGTAVDRQWLQGEARRDPQQFLDVAKRIGVAMPQPAQTPPPSVTAPPAAPVPAIPAVPPGSAPAALPPPALPAPPVAPVAAPVPVAPVALAAPAPPPPPPPVILGPNGQPLLPSGVA